MGYVKMGQDIEEKVIINKEDKFIKLKNQGIKDIKLIKCPYCMDLINVNKIKEHINSKHNSLGSFIILNDKLIKTNTYTNSIDNVYLFIFNDVNCYYIDNYKFICTGKNFYDITEKVLEQFNKNGYVEIKIGEEIINVKKYDVEAIKSPQINFILKDWNKKIAANDVINKSTICLSEVEKHYLDGFFNYYMACKAKKDDKKNRYEEAYGIFNSFIKKDNRIRCAMQVIFLKWNWFANLFEITNDDEVFKIVCDFFKKEKIKENYNINNTNDYLYVENEISDYIEAVVSFMNNDYTKVHKYFDNNKNLYLFDSPMRDKIYYLKYRMMIVENDEYAKNMFEEIKDKSKFVQ